MLSSLIHKNVRRKYAISLVRVLGFNFLNFSKRPFELRFIKSTTGARPGPDNEQIYLKYKYTHENAGFCILGINDFKIIKKFEFFTIFHRETSQAS